jgi:thioredoxin-related protein
MLTPTHPKFYPYFATTINHYHIANLQPEICFKKIPMKKTRLFFLFLGLMWVSLSIGVNAQPKGTTKTTPAKADSTAIRWLTLDEVQVAMKKQPKKVLMDVYTDWCGWCKKMDVTTFTHQEVVKYVNQNFYAVKLNAERTDTVRFMGKIFAYNPETRAHPLAIELLQGRMSYPTTVIMGENFGSIQPIPGYLTPENMEMILKYFHQNLQRSRPWDDYQKSFVPSWH